MKTPIVTLEDGKRVLIAGLHSYILPNEGVEKEIDKNYKKYFATLKLVSVLLIVGMFAILPLAYKISYGSNIFIISIVVLNLLLSPIVLVSRKIYIDPLVKNLEKIKSEKNKKTKRYLSVMVVMLVLTISYYIPGAIFGILNLQINYHAEKQEYNEAIKYLEILKKYDTKYSNFYLSGIIHFKKKLNDDVGAQKNYEELLLSYEKQIEKNCTKQKENISCYYSYHNRGVDKAAMDDYCGAKKDYEKLLGFYDNSQKLRKQWHQTREGILKDIQELEQKCN